jgi:hypothetical protein
MSFRVAIALLALAVPVFAQRGSAHAGSFGSPGSSGSRGFAGHIGFSAPSGFSHPSSPARSAPSFRYGASGTPGFREISPPNHSNFRIPYNANRYPASRLQNHRIAAQPSSAQNRTSNSGRDSSRDLFDARRRSFHNWYVYNYPNWLGYGYPYLIDPGFYDWDDSDNSAPDNSAYAQSGAIPDYPAPYPDYGYGAPGETPYPPETPPAIAQYRQRAFAGPAAPSAPAQALTVIFKSGRAPVKMQNYMMTAKVLTDLDSRHYEQIPIDQIDVLSTQWANSAVGVRFEIPCASRD